MKLNVNGKYLNEEVKDRLITNTIYTLPVEDNSSITLSKNDTEYIQTSGGPAKGFRLEYQDGYNDQHYTSSNENLSTEQVAKAFKYYLAENDKWKTDFSWEKAKLRLPEIKSKGKIVNILYGLAVAGYLIWKYFFSQ